MNTIELNDEEARKLGFENLAELLRLVAKVNLSSAGAIHDFKEWQNNDGTKEGLLKLIDSEK